MRLSSRLRRLWQAVLEVPAWAVARAAWELERVQASA